MEESKSNRNWPLAILAAVVFPALALHGTCVSVLGPGTWGSGLVETRPDFKAPTPAAEAYRQEFQADPRITATGAEALAPQTPAGMKGNVVWKHAIDDRALYLTEGPERSRRRLYVSGTSSTLREVPLPNGHLIARPQWTADGIVYVRWNPWAVPPTSKFRRYVASWFDPSLRPESSLYGNAPDTGAWHFLMPGHSLTVSPDGRRAALLRSGALLAGYYSVHVWRVGSSDAPAIMSLREHGSDATRSFRIQWSADSSALHLQGRTGGFDRRSSHGGADSGGIPINLLYMINDATVYDLNLGS
ncbi:MAG: hypothetical protein OXJ37_11560 [Bryobacterales bacterium]|nr:hypothetical protein [Bryobacterales bacterium]